MITERLAVARLLLDAESVGGAGLIHNSTELSRSGIISIVPRSTMDGRYRGPLDKSAYRWLYLKLGLYLGDPVYLDGGHRRGSELQGRTS